MSNLILLGKCLMSSLRSLHLLRSHRTKPVAAHPTEVSILVPVQGLKRGCCRFSCSCFGRTVEHEHLSLNKT